MTLKIETMKMHIGVSRSVWKASYIMAQQLEKAVFADEGLRETLKLESSSNILELGSGTGLGGIFVKKLLPQSSVVMTDICTKSLQSIRNNLSLNELIEAKKQSLSNV